MINNRINQLFSEISFYLQKEANENAAYAILNSIECLATQFRPDQICEAKNFQYRWEEMKQSLKELALTSDFEKYSKGIDQMLEEILEPEKWEDKLESRKNGSIEKEIYEATKFFTLMTMKTKASV